MNLSIIWLLEFVLLVKGLPLPSCTDDQYTKILPNNSTTCVHCFKCPDGLGPSVECGSTITTDTKLECKICTIGVNFSPSNDYEQCQPCSICSDDQVSKPCTTSSDTVCEKKCISKENYYEKSSDDCQPCSYCCGDGNDQVMSECVEKGMPAHKSCTVHRRKKCTPSPTTGRPTTLPSTTIPATTTQPTIRNKSTTTPQSATRKIFITPQSSTREKPTSLTSSRSMGPASSTGYQVSIGVSCGLGFILAVCLVCLLMVYRHRICCKYYTSHSKATAGDSEAKLKMIYTKKDVIDNFKETMLFEILKSNHQLKEKVCNKLDLKRFYAKLARHYGMDEDKVKKLEDNPGDAPTCAVFDFIEGLKPELSLGEFISYMEKIGKNDVINCFTKELQTEIHVQLS